MAKRKTDNQVRYILDRSRSMRDSDVIFRVDTDSNKYTAIMYLRKPKWLKKDKYEEALKELFLPSDTVFE